MKYPEFNGGIILNIDFNSVTFPFLTRAVQEENFNKETLYPFVDQYADTQVKALAFNTFCYCSATPSAAWDDVIKLSKRTEENGVAVDYSNDQWAGLVACYEKYDIDPYEVWFERCREKNIEPWLSLRMNDCHCPFDETFLFRSDFFYEAKENGWMIGEIERPGIYFFQCLDYAVPQVRQKMLDYIEEQVNQYDVAGLELDFMREIFCFNYMECADKLEIMNDFIRKVKAIVTEAEKKHGHPIKILARLARDVDQCMAYGFDVETWDEEKLVDMICVTARYHSCDSDMPIGDWKLRCPNMEICAGIEMNHYRYRPEHKMKLTEDMANGFAAAYVCQGADVVYMYNFFIDPYWDLKEWGWETKRTNSMIRRIGSGETIFTTRRRHVIMHQDEEMTPIGFDPYHPLPAPIASGETKAFTLPIGYVPEGRKARLLIGMESGTPEDMKVVVNGKPCCGLTKCDEETIVSFESWPGRNVVADSVTLYIADIPARSLGRYTVSVTANKDIEVDYIEVDIQ